MHTDEKAMRAATIVDRLENALLLKHPDAGRDQMSARLQAAAIVYAVEELTDWLAANYQRGG